MADNPPQGRPPSGGLRRYTVDEYIFKNVPQIMDQLDISAGTPEEPAEEDTLGSSPGPCVKLIESPVKDDGHLIRFCVGVCAVASVWACIRNKHLIIEEDDMSEALPRDAVVPVKWMAAATQASAKGFVDKSRRFLFLPMKGERPSRKRMQTLRKRLHTLECTLPERRMAPVWRDGAVDGQLMREGAIYGEQGLADDNIWSIIRTVLPYLLFRAHANMMRVSKGAKGKSIRTEERLEVPIKLRIHGYTNGPAGSIEYVQQVIVPVLQRRLDLKVSVQLERRGLWGSSAGMVTLEVMPISPGWKLPAFNFLSRSFILRFAVSLVVPTKDLVQGMQDRLKKALRLLRKDAEIHFPVTEVVEEGRSIDITLVAETSNCSRIGSHFCGPVSEDKADRFEVAQKGMEEAGLRLEREIHHEGPADADQQRFLTIFQALAAGTSTVVGGTADVTMEMDALEQLLNIKFNREAGSCKGIGLVADP